MRDNFTFQVSTTVRSCSDCPHFREVHDDSPTCSHIFANGSITWALRHRYSDEIHKDCPERPTEDDSEEEEE